jgi:hypothetical protein
MLDRSPPESRRAIVDAAAYASRMLIGERTAGANHFGGIEPIGAGLAAFIPVGRTYDPDTGKDWESTGVAPESRCSPIKPSTRPWRWPRTERSSR